MLTAERACKPGLGWSGWPAGGKQQRARAYVWEGGPGRARPVKEGSHRECRCNQVGWGGSSLRPGDQRRGTRRTHRGTWGRGGLGAVGMGQP